MGVNPTAYKYFIKYDIRVKDKEVTTIMNSLVQLDELRNNIIYYKRRVKPSTILVKKLSLQ